MLRFLPVAALLLALATIINALPSTNATFIAQEISKISVCGLDCLKTTIPKVGCSFVNTTCQCSSIQLVQITSECMLANCTLAEAFELSEVQAAICELPYESQNEMLKTMTIICTIISFGALFFRLISRGLLRQSLGLDDWSIIVTAVMQVGFVYFGVQAEKHGLGDHLWNTDEATLPQLLFWFYICEILYVLSIGLVKISILFFYLRIFPKSLLRALCWVTMAFCASNTIAFTITAIFQCTPISYAWMRDMKGGKCIDFNLSSWVHAGVNILQDIIIIVLPMNKLRHLQLDLRKKIGIYAIFGIGSFVCVTSIIRLGSLRTFGLTADPTWDNTPTTFWSTLEMTAAMLCACMPAIRAGFLRLSQKVNGTSFVLSTEPHTSRLSTNNGASSTVLSRTRPRIPFISLSPSESFHEQSQNSQIKILGAESADAIQPATGAATGQEDHNRMGFIKSFMGRGGKSRQIPLVSLTPSNRSSADVSWKTRDSVSRGRS